MDHAGRWISRSRVLWARTAAFIALVVLAACSDDTATTAPRTRLTIGSASPASGAAPCAMGIRWNAPVSAWTYWATPQRDTSCGVTYVMSLDSVDLWLGGRNGAVFETYSSPTTPANQLMTPFSTYRWAGGDYGVQNGPIMIRFETPIDRFRSEISAFPGNALTGPLTQRIVALDAMDNVLIDTTGGLVTELVRTRMRTVRVYPSYYGIVRENGDSVVFKRWYSMSFRPDSSCPPSGDTLADSRAFRDTLLKMMEMGSANGPWRTRREFMAAGWPDLDGTTYLVIISSGNACSVVIPTPDVPPPTATTPYPIAYAHVHVQNTGEWVHGCENIAPSDSVLAAPNENGGGSKGDWENATRTGRPVYAFSKEGILSRLDPYTSKWQWRNSKNRWRRGSNGCFVKLP
jgi:hypothetical protein